MGQRVPYSRNSPVIYAGSNAKLLTNGGLEFKEGTVVHPYAGNPNGVLILPIGSLVIDNVNSKVYQATDSLGGYSEVGSGGEALTIGEGLDGDGSIGDPLRIDAASMGPLVASAATKASPVDADIFPFADTEAGNVLVKLTFGEIKTALKTYFDTLYGGDGMAFANVEVSGTQNVPALTEVELATYTVPAGLKAQWLAGAGSSDGLTRFRVTADGVDRIVPTWNTLMELMVGLQAPLEFPTGTVLRVFGYNDTLEGNTNSVSATLYLKTVSA